MPRLVEIGPVVLEKMNFEYFQKNFTFLLISPLGKGRGPSFEQTWIPFTQRCFVPSLVEIGFGEEDENVKSLQQGQQRQWQRTNFDHLNL